MTTKFNGQNNYIVEFNGEPVTNLSFESSGKANVTTGDLVDAIKYTSGEAHEAAAAIGRGAEAVRQ